MEKKASRGPSLGSRESVRSLLSDGPMYVRRWRGSTGSRGQGLEVEKAIKINCNALSKKKHGSRLGSISDMAED